MSHASGHPLTAPVLGPRTLDTITVLAENEGKRLHILRATGDAEEQAETPPSFPTVAWIDIGTDASHSGILRATGWGHEGHDNEPRMTVVCNFLNRCVLPYLEGSGGFGNSVSGRYAIELHDTYTYLDRPAAYAHDDAGWEAAHRNTMVFSRGATDAHPTLIPDPFQMTNYAGKLDEIVDTKPWEEKTPAMFFAGTTTGSRDAVRNQRVRRCVWSLGHRDVAHFYITRIAQMDPRAALLAVPRLSEVLHDVFPEGHHVNYRVAANIAGNTCSWSRVPAVLRTRSVLFDYAQPDVQWFSGALREGTHYVSVSDDDVLTRFHEYVHDKIKCQAMCDAANRFAASFTRPMHAAIYFKTLLQTAAINSK